MAEKMKAAWIGMMGREAFQDPWKTFEEYAKIGYKGVETDATMLPGDPEDNVKRLADMGLKPLSVFGGNLQRIEENIADLGRRARINGVDRVTIFSISVIQSFGRGYGNNGTYEELMKDIDDMNRVIPKLAEEGLKLTYHNHYQEFMVYYKGAPAIDHFLLEVDDRLTFELDLGWVAVGGKDPAVVMDYMKDRIAALHFKDFYDLEKPKYLVNSNREDDFAFTAVGTGKLDLNVLLKKGVEIGQEWAIVEQDRLRNLSYKEAMTTAYLAMKETGYLE